VAGEMMGEEVGAADGYVGRGALEIQTGRDTER
jgi:hypothetical protein